jgi:hypothetical protein
LVRHFGFGPNGVVNALRPPAKIGVECAQDDTCMSGRPVLMRAKKVAAIVGQQNPAVSDRERQNFGVGHGLRDDLQWNIFVSVETGPLYGVSFSRI